jgi:UDP-N-acetylglucosamine:LPS N-acetylglucosamine transferase
MTRNICIYFSDTGGGHRSAADALEAGIRDLIDRCSDRPDISIIKDPIAEKSHPINRRFVELYNYLLRHHQPLMKYYYWFLHMIRPESGLNLALTADFLCKTLKEQQPAVVVSVHPMINHCVAKALEITGMAGTIKLVSVITDPNADLWRAWGCNKCDLLVAPNDVVKEKLIGWGVDADKIEVLGMSVHPSFVKPPTIDRQDFLTHLGLSPDAVTICINAGWAGGGNMLRIYKSLAKVKRPIQVIFLCGHNTALYEQAMAAAAESDIPTAVLPFHDAMYDLMSSVDMMVTKAGGLTTYEAIAKRLPLAFDMLTEPMPQERGTVEMLIEQSLAKGIQKPDEVVAIVEELNVQKDRWQVQLPTKHNFNLTDSAVYTTAERVLNMMGITVPAKAEPAPEAANTDEEIYIRVN